MENSLNNVLERIGPHDRVLDLGAWNAVIPRADVVIDVNPYDTRRHAGEAATAERFTRDSWIQGDVHSRELWTRFGAKEFDFIICSHFLEDIRDPLFVCEQMNRVGRAGYIECPSRFRECAKARAHDIGSGYDHHRWIVDVIDGELVLTPKMGWAHAFDYLGSGRRGSLSGRDVQFVALSGAVRSTSTSAFRRGTHSRRPTCCTSTTRSIRQRHLVERCAGRPGVRADHARDMSLGDRLHAPGRAGSAVRCASGARPRAPGSGH